MTRITPIDPGQATGKTRQLLDGVQTELGSKPNLMMTFAHSPATLEGYLRFSRSLGHGYLVGRHGGRGRGCHPGAERMPEIGAGRQYHLQADMAIQKTGPGFVHLPGSIGMAIHLLASLVRWG